MCSLDFLFGVDPEASDVETESDEHEPMRRRKAKPPLTAFCIFMNGFRKSFRQDYLGTLIKDVAKFGVEQWNSMTEDVRPPPLEGP
ncbi:putative chromatin remodeling & transcriptional activation HMG family [Arabidopsis thaliana]